MNDDKSVFFLADAYLLDKGRNLAAFGLLKQSITPHITTILHSHNMNDQRSQYCSD